MKERLLNGETIEFRGELDEMQVSYIKVWDGTKRFFVMFNGKGYKSTLTWPPVAAYIERMCKRYKMEEAI